MKEINQSNYNKSSHWSWISSIFFKNNINNNKVLSSKNEKKNMLL